MWSTGRNVCVKENNENKNYIQPELPKDQPHEKKIVSIKQPSKNHLLRDRTPLLKKKKTFSQ